MVNNPSVHYLGVEGSTTIWGDHARCEAQWERIKSERASEYGPDGAYNFGGCNSHGIRMEGRGWNRDSAANGVEGGVSYNPGSRALCVLVGTDDEITPQCQEMVRVFANEAVNDHGMAWPLKGHSEFVATSCPGDHLRQTIRQVNNNPSAAPPPAPPIPVEDDPVLFVKDPRNPVDIWCLAGNTRRHVTPSEWKMRSGPYGGNPYAENPGGAYKALTIDAAWFDSYPVAA